MSKPYTDADFSFQITSDRSWRLKEISDLKATIRSSDTRAQKVLLRALVTICYAHWEGYVRFAASKYLEFICLRKYPFKQLDRQFLRSHFLPRLEALSKSKSSVADRNDLLEKILTAEELRFSRVNYDLINTKSNLNSEVFAEICLVCCIDEPMLQDKSAFIDIFLLKRRNAIAHGEDTFIDLGELEELSTETVNLLRLFGDSLENKVSLQGYRSL